MVTVPVASRPPMRAIAATTATTRAVTNLLRWAAGTGSSSLAPMGPKNFFSVTT